MKSNLKNSMAWLLLLILTVAGFNNSDLVDYLRVTKRLELGTAADSVVVTGGKVKSNSVWQFKGIITDTNYFASNFWQVSPGFLYNKHKKTSASIKTILDSLGSDSALIYVHPGVYLEKFSAKNNVTIIGSAQNKVFLHNKNDSNIIYCYNVSNFTLKNMTIIDSTYLYTGEASVIKLYRSFTDSTSIPKVTFDNLRIIHYDDDSDTIACILADSSSFTLMNSYLFIENGSGAGSDPKSGCVKIRNMSHPVISYNKLVGIGDNTGALFSAIRLTDITCRPIVNGNIANGYRFITAGDAVDLKTWQNIVNVANVNIGQLLSTTDNIVDANLIIR